MSRLRERLNKLADWEQDMKDTRDSMQMSDSQVCRELPGPKYKNAWGTVSPLALLVNDQINAVMCEATVAAAADFVKDNIESLNSKYSGDPFYDTMSEEYIKKLWYRLTQCKNMNQVLTKLTDSLNAGYEGKKQRAEDESEDMEKEASSESIINEIKDGLTKLLDLLK